MSCPRCRAGDTHLCQRYDAVGFTRSGGWGEFVVVPARILHPLPDHVSFEAAALVEPGSCVVKALGRARIEPAETVGVVGVGAMGALAIRIARLRSPASDRRVRAARRGARACASARGGRRRQRRALRTPQAETRRLVGGGLDVVVETAGAVPAVELSTRLAREGGRVVLLGIAGQDQELALPADRIAAARPLDLRQRRLHDGGVGARWSRCSASSSSISTRSSRTGSRSSASRTRSR